MISKNQIKFIRQLEQKKFRHREGLFVAEGTKVVGDRLEVMAPQTVIGITEWIESHRLPANVETVIVDEDELFRFCFRQSEMPTAESIFQAGYGLPPPRDP